MPRTFNYIAPSLQPATLLDISITEPGPSRPSESHLTSISISPGSYEPVGNFKRISQTASGQLVLADDAFGVSYLSSKGEDGWGEAAEVVAQSKVEGKGGDFWSGLIPIKSRHILFDIRAPDIPSKTFPFLRICPQFIIPLSYTVDGPVLALATASSSSMTFALAGNEVDVSIRDIERTFTSHSHTNADDRSKRRKTELVDGEIWRAKNMPNNSLRLRPPIHHLSLAYVPDIASPSVTNLLDNVNGTQAAPNLEIGEQSNGESSGTHLISGTKAGTVRRYDTRQRKPVEEWKLAREGGIGALAPVTSNEVFFSDKSNFLGCADLRTGKLLYSYPSLTSSAHHLIYLPPSLSSSSVPTSTRYTRISRNEDTGGAEGEGYLASISPDATLRLHSTVPPRQQGQKGNPEGGKAKVVGIAGGVGLGSFAFTGYGRLPDMMTEVSGSRRVRAGRKNGGSEDEEADGSDTEEEDGEDVWDGLDAVEAADDDGEEDDTDDE